MARESSPSIQGVESYLSAIRDTGQSLRRKFKGDPEALAKRLGLLLPEKPLQVMKQLGLYDPVKHGPIEPGLRELVLDVCLGEVESALAVAGRGTGKSQGVSFIEFYLVFIEMFDALNLGGSELQADQVYQYLLSYIDSDPYWLNLVKGEPMRERTYTVDDAWIRVLTASGKSVRSPHAGGYKSKTKRWAGGILVIDEEAEAERDIVESALPTINTAKPSVNVRSSTFHNVVGSFADLVENHEQMGYKKYVWNLIDVCTGCSCGPDACESEEKCFREDHIETYVDPDTGIEVEKLLHRAYCGGLARYARGWVEMDEIIKMWRRMNRNHSRFEVEGMGWRPTTSGYVIRDQQNFNNNTVDLTGKQLYLPGCPVTIVVDWGVVAAGFEVWQLHLNGKHVLIECEELAENTPTQMESRIVSTYKKYIKDDPEVAADIGGGGNYMNARLEEVHGIPVRGVNFNEEKEAAVAVWNIFNEGQMCMYPKEFPDFLRQAKKWKRKNGKIAKGDDHLCDAAVCYFAKYIDDLGVQRVRVAPQTFSSATQVPDYGGQRQSSDPSNTGRAPVMLPLRGR